MTSSEPESLRSHTHALSRADQALFPPEPHRERVTTLFELTWSRGSRSPQKFQTAQCCQLRKRIAATLRKEIRLSIT